MKSLTVWVRDDPEAVKKSVRPILEIVAAGVPVTYVPFGNSFTCGPDHVVLAMGLPPFEAMQEQKLISKGRTIGSLRGKVLVDAVGTSYMVSYDPRAVEVDAAKREEISWDLQLVCRLARTGSLAPEVGDYRWVEDFTDLLSAIDCKYASTGSPVEVALDLETQGINPYDTKNYILAVGATCEVGKADCVYVPDLTTEAQAQGLLGTLTRLLTHPHITLRGANLKFDLNWIAVKWGGLCTNFKFDTMLVGSLLNENRSNSLNHHAKVHTTIGGYDDAFNAKHDKSKMALVPKADMLPYLGGDVDACLQVSIAMKQELLSQPRLANFYVNCLHPVARAYERVERAGFCVHRERYRELEADVVRDVESLTKQALALLPARIRNKYADSLSLGRDVVLRDYFFSPLGLDLKPRMLTEKTQAPSMAKAHLTMFSDEPEAVQMCAVLQQLGVSEKTLSTYIRGFLSHLRDDGRLHPTFFLFNGRESDGDDDSGTNTGRLSAKDPAVQTIPKRTKWAKRIRHCLIAPPGYGIAAVDANQGELRVTACVAHEPVMLDAYAQALDLHAITAASMTGVSLTEFLSWQVLNPDKYSLFRDRAKSVNFGFVYGMSAAGFQVYAWASYGLKLTLQECEEYRAAFFDKYEMLTRWHTQFKTFARKHGWVESPLGRVRHLPLIFSAMREIAAKAERQAVNAPIQSTLSDITGEAVTAVVTEVPEAEPFGTVHDQTLAYVPLDSLESSGRRIQAAANAVDLKKRFGWDHQIDFPFDLEISSDSLATFTKVKASGLTA